MRIVHISSTIHGGAGRAAWRLHEAMLHNGINSVFLSDDVMADIKSAQNHYKLELILPNTFLKRVIWKIERSFLDRKILKQKKKETPKRKTT